MRYNPKKHRLPPFTSSGVLLVDKPAEWTSFDVVNFVRARFNVPKVGHCGTLDPAATGLLVLVLGKFTALSQKFSGEDKVYDATLLLGQETDSGDTTGEVIATGDVSLVTEEMVRDQFQKFIGTQMQVPPMVSAIKVDGKKLDELAREGKMIEREAKEITIHELAISRLELPECDFRMHCSKGTYVRSFCSDIGKELGCYGTLKALRRIRSGMFELADAISVDQLKTMEQADLDIHLRKYLYEKLSRIQGLQA